VLVAQDLSPADMLQFKSKVFAGFITAVGGKTSHTAIVARSMDIPAVVGARAASQLIRQDDWVIIDGNEGVVIVDPTPIILAEYSFRQRQTELERERLTRLRYTPSLTMDGQKVELLAIEQPSDGAAAACWRSRGGAVPYRVSVHGAQRQSAREEEQYRAYREAIDGMQGMPVTIRTLDGGRQAAGQGSAQGLLPQPRAGPARHPLESGRPAMFRTQLRAIARRSAWAGQAAVSHAGPSQRDRADPGPAAPGAA
jgi:phosphotransferase system enzyme I (PtsI)